MRWTRTLPGLGLAALAVGPWAPPATATHDSACSALPTSGTTLETYGCNPRQNCLDAAGGNAAKRAACNALPTSGSCTRTANTNPRADCVAALPAPPPLSVSAASFEGARRHTYPNAHGWLFVRGTNVAAPGVSVSPDGGGYTAVVAAPRPDLNPGCVPPACLTLDVRVEANAAPGARTLTLRSGDGHRTATVRFDVVAEPSAAGPPRPHQPVTTRGSGSGGGGAGCLVVPGKPACPPGKTLDPSNCTCR